MHLQKVLSHPFVHSFLDFHRILRVPINNTSCGKTSNASSNISCTGFGVGGMENMDLGQK